jgi:hypothetical protein
MNRKSISDLSTTFSSIKDSFTSNESEQNEITAIISSYTIKHDENKYFNKDYALYQIKFCTRYKTWSVQKRYSQFIELRDKLLLKKIKNIPKLPPKLYFTSEQKLAERQLGLEEFLNDLFKNVNILRYPEIIDFISCPKEIIDILTYNMDYLNMINLNSSSIINTTDNNLYYKGRVTISNMHRNNSENHINKNDKDNFYCSLAKMNLNSDKIKSNDKNYFAAQNDTTDEEEKISHGKIIIQEFLRNLIRTPYNKTELLYQFEYFLLNKNNEEDKSNSIFNWYFLTEDEIKIFFNGFYSNISHTKINGFLYHCGKISNNILASEQCLEFLNKLLNDDYNPQADTFLKIYKRCNLNDITQMELERHIIQNSNNVRIYAFMVLYKYIEDNNDFEFQIKKILNNKKAEELFLQWYNIEISNL